MDIMQMFIIGSSILGGLLIISLIVLFFVSRRSQKVMESLLLLMTKPERAKIHDAVRVLQTILADEISKIESSFQNISSTLNSQIASANELKTTVCRKYDPDLFLHKAQNKSHLSAKTLNMDNIALLCENDR